MTVTCLGKIAVTTAGTPVRVTATPTPCYGLIVSPVIGNAGATHFGVAGLTKATLVGVIKTFLKPAATGVNDTLEFTAREGNPLNAADFYVDAETNGDALVVSYITA
jgi:hypothetical protein